MSAEENRKIIAAIFDDLALGESRRFIDSFSDGFEWDMKGSTAWSGLYEGKTTVLKKLLAPLLAQFGDRYTNRAVRIIADGDVVVVECRGRVTTKKGKPYNNEYCFVFEMQDGKIRRLTEYLDTALVNEALDPPPAA